jgi:pimeloyl-ACP methyl ester carboxylesterase
MSIYRSGAALAIDEDGTSIQQLRTGDGPQIILANGFLSQSVTGWDRWKRAVTDRYPGRSVFRLRWEAQVIESIKPLVAALDTGGDPNKLLEHAKGQVSSAFNAIKSGKLPNLPFFAAPVEATAKWIIAKDRATATGLALAEAIKNSAPEDTFTLMGFSLGARVMATAAKALADQEIFDKLESVHLIGAAINRSPSWQPITEAVSVGLWNYFSRNDSVLSMLYRTAEVGAEPAGLSGLKLEGDKVHDVDVTSEVFSHRGYLPVIDLQ